MNIYIIRKRLCHRFRELSYSKLNRVIPILSISSLSKGNIARSIKMDLMCKGKGKGQGEGHGEGKGKMS